MEEKIKMTIKKYGSEYAVSFTMTVPVFVMEKALKIEKKFSKSAVR